MLPGAEGLMLFGSDSRNADLAGSTFWIVAKSPVRESSVFEANSGILG
jgi:hypothetical protein